MLFVFTETWECCEKSSEKASNKNITKAITVQRKLLKYAQIVCFCFCVTKVYIAEGN